MGKILKEQGPLPADYS